MSSKIKNKIKNFKSKKAQVKAAIDNNKEYKNPPNRKFKKRTWPEKETGNILHELNIAYEIEKPLEWMNTWKHFDIFIKDYGVLIEVDGDYWHGNVKSENVNGLMIQMKNKQNDAIKNFVASKHGYKLLRIQEGQLKDDREGVKKIITDFIEKEATDEGKD